MLRLLEEYEYVAGDLARGERNVDALLGGVGEQLDALTVLADAGVTADDSADRLIRGSGRSGFAADEQTADEVRTLEPL